MFLELFFLFQKVIVVAALLEGGIQAFFSRLDRKIGISVDEMVENVADGLNGRIGLELQVGIADFHEVSGVWVFIALDDCGLLDFVGGLMLF